MFKVIMAPTEGSSTERTAISVAVKLAQRLEADLRLVRVDPMPVGVENVLHPPVLEITEQTLREERLVRLRKLEALGSQCRAIGDIRVMVSLEEGPVAPTLADYTKKFAVDLIVMSSHSRGGLRRIALGSVTDYLIRRSNVPVLVVREGASFIAAGNGAAATRIVVPLDGSALAEQILPSVASLALRVNASVNLLHILTPDNYSQKRVMQPGLPWWDEDIALAEYYLTHAASCLADERVPVTKDVVLSDNVASAILDYAQRTGADLMAIATSGKGGLNRLVFGSVADELARKAATSLLVFHPRPDAPAAAESHISEPRVAAVS